MSAAYVLSKPFPLTGNEIVDLTTNGYKWYFPAGTPRVLNWSPLYGPIQYYSRQKLKLISPELLETSKNLLMFNLTF